MPTELTIIGHKSLSFDRPLSPPALSVSFSTLYRSALSSVPGTTDCSVPCGHPDVSVHLRFCSHTSLCLGCCFLIPQNSCSFLSVQLLHLRRSLLKLHAWCYVLFPHNTWRTCLFPPHTRLWSFFNLHSPVEYQILNRFSANGWINLWFISGFAIH